MSKRTKSELVYIVIVSACTVAFAALLVVGVPALLAARAVERGTTPLGLALGGAAAAWVAVTAYALVTDRVTRGWIGFLLLGWAPAVVAWLRSRR